MFLVTGLGITVGYHRMATHLSFRSPAWVRYLLAVAGSMAVEGPIIEWCGEHRKHHQHSDLAGDPHSPHMSPDGSWGEGIRGTLRGAFHAHVGWLFSGETSEVKGLDKYTKDLRADPAIVAADRQFVPWVIVGLLLPAVLGGLITMTWSGALLGFLWGGLVRVLLVHHVTWSVNSVCHLWGSRPYRSHDESRNNAIVGILGLGEGWHNNHHAFPTSAKHGLAWWQFDLSYLVIRALWIVGLARDVRVPDKARRDAKRVRRG
jgi:stearoyl-CoA desaturase (delta-9 desaturase)